MSKTEVVKIKVNTYKEVLLCKKCKIHMIWNGICLTSNPAQYPHKCPKCYYTENVIGHSYPRTVYEVE